MQENCKLTLKIVHSIQSSLIWELRGREPVNMQRVTHERVQSRVQPIQLLLKISKNQNLTTTRTPNPHCLHFTDLQT